MSLLTTSAVIPALALGATKAAYKSADNAEMAARPLVEVTPNTVHIGLVR
jgi:hypothetical protein